MLLIRINFGEKVVTQIACHISVILHGTVGNTLTPSFLANGKTDTELMRIAYVAMTRPRKLLVIAMPKSKTKLSNRFPPNTWDYVEL